MAYVIRSALEKGRLVAAWRRSGLARTRFAEEHGIAPSSFAKWVASDDGRPVSFVPVRVVEPVGATDAPPFLVELAGAGHRVHVPAGFDVAAFRRLVESLC